MESLQFITEKFTIAHINSRVEKHEDEDVTAFDIKLTSDMPNAVLSKFHPDLKQALYKGDATVDMHNPDFMPHLRIPLLTTFAYNLEIPRVTLLIHDIDDISNDIRLYDGKSKKFKFELLDGGTVKLSFTTSFSDVDEDRIAKLFRVLGQRMPVTMRCMEEEEQPDNFQKVENLSHSGAHSDARKEAENLFEKTEDYDDYVDSEEPQNGFDEVVDAEIPGQGPTKKRGKSKGMSVE